MERRLSAENDLLVFSHLRWDFVFQRPQHLLSRFARHRRVLYVEEPVFGQVSEARLHIKDEARFGSLKVVIPHLPHGETDVATKMKVLVDELIEAEGLGSYTIWYYTPMALEFTRHLEPETTIYDCMDELANFKNAPANLLENEKDLFSRADLVFTGGHSLFERKRNLHRNIHPFPSSIDFAHFAKARRLATTEPEDMASIPRPRIGFYGVIDERTDLDLLAAVAKAKPDRHFVMLGPVVKIDPASLPRLSNVHYLGKKDYDELPAYLASWDAAMMPFAQNESTRFISPTKTPEFLAAGLPVVSTPIEDVVRPYGVERLVHIADSPDWFAACVDKALEQRENVEWRAKVDTFLSKNSWDLTWRKMADLELKLQVDFATEIDSNRILDVEKVLDGAVAPV